jgi:hypothetical protein
MYQQDWTKMEMVMLLVSEGVELRNESNIEKLSLRDLCDAVSQHPNVRFMRAAGR